jgi:four helix bundle protein
MHQAVWQVSPSAMHHAVRQFRHAPCAMHLYYCTVLHAGLTMAKFRFQDLEIWKEAIEIGNILFDIADKLEEKKLFRFAEQLRSAGMSISNNIAEGSGSSSKAEFRNFLNIAKRSTFENANILILLNKRQIVEDDQLNKMLDRLEILCRKISNFQKALVKG